MFGDKDWVGMVIVLYELERILYDNVVIIYVVEFLYFWSLDSVKSNKDVLYFYIKF